MTTTTNEGDMAYRSDLEAGLVLGLNGDPDQRAATLLLSTAVGGVWLAKLAGWEEYLVPLHDLRRPASLYIDWRQLRDDRAADGTVRGGFAAWADSPRGRRATDDEHDAHWARTVPDRPWRGASTGELAILDIALAIAPGGLLAEGIVGLDPNNREASRLQWRRCSLASTAILHWGMLGARAKPSR